MEYKDIKRIIEEDYNNVQSVRVIKGGRSSMKTFYVDFSKALDELHLAVGPFVTDTDQFIEYIKYIKERVSPNIYSIIITYCKDKLKLNIGG